MVRTWGTSFKYFVYPSRMDNDIVNFYNRMCIVPSQIFTNHGDLKSLMFLNHSPWLVMWFEALESIYQMWCYQILVIKFTICCITKNCSCFDCLLMHDCLVPNVMLMLVIIICHMYKFMIKITIWAIVWLLTLLISTVTPFF